MMGWEIGTSFNTAAVMRFVFEQGLSEARCWTVVERFVYAVSQEQGDGFISQQEYTQRWTGATSACSFTPRGNFK